MPEETESVPVPGPRPHAVRLFAPGTEVGTRYEIRSVLGTGGSASVYAAWDRELKRLVALKALRHDRMSETALKRFRREVAVARDADSPRLVRVYDIGEAGETVFLTMELVEGGSLRERLEKSPLETREAVRIGKEILRALADLHRLGIVHRDIKPGNVLLAEGGGVKLADFGLARHWEGGDTRATETEGIVGTMEYLAPEQALGKTVDARTDVYAFGVLLYEMLSGSVPFVSDSVLGGVVARLREPAPDVRKVRTEVPGWLASVVAKTLEKEPGRRYATAGEVLDDLEAERSQGNRWRRAWSGRSGRSARLQAAGAAAVVALGLCGAWIATKGLPGRRPDPPRLMTDGNRGLKAVDGAGRTLWSRPDVRGAETAAVVRGERGRLLVAAVLEPMQGTRLSKETSVLTFLDPASGKVTGSQRTVSGAGSFPGFTDSYSVARVAAVDIEGDGVDEVVVIFTHTPFYPGYVVLFEPRSGGQRVVLAHSGHPRLRGAFDLDGDGRRELVFDGPNNRMGWMTGIAAVRVPPLSPPPESQRGGPNPGPVSSPDMVLGEGSPTNLLWYALGPTAPHRIDDPASFDPASRLLTLRAGAATRVLTADGFAPGREPRDSGPDRQAARFRAYALLRDAVQREETGFASDALAPARRAIEEARAAADDYLVEWAHRVAGRIAIRAGRASEGEKELSDLLSTSEAAAEIAYEMARAFHFAGETARSARWYSWGISRVRENAAGRSNFEFLEGQVFVLAEARRWAEAEEAIARFSEAFPGTGFPATYRAFLLWRRGGRPVIAPGEVMHAEDLGRYWRLEFRLDAGEGLEILSRDLAAERAVASETHPLLLSLSAEIEARRGNLEGALEQASAAWSEVRAARLRQTWARAHASFVAGRLARIAERAGRPDVAREARAALGAAQPRQAPLVRTTSE